MSGRHVRDEEQNSTILLNLTHPREMGIFTNLIGKNFCGYVHYSNKNFKKNLYVGKCHK